MNKRVYIRQNGTIPGHRIIEELERRGGKNNYVPFGYNGESIYCYYYIEGKLIRFWAPRDVTPHSPLEGYTELLYNEETDSFCEKSQRMTAGEAKEAILQDCCVQTDIPYGEMKTYSIMTEGEYAIPKGYEAVIEDGKVIVRKKKWQPKEGEIIYFPIYLSNKFSFAINSYTYIYGSIGIDDFPTKEEAQTLCDKLNAAIEPIFEERRKETEK